MTMGNDEIILTIGIPNYNRSDLLRLLVGDTISQIRSISKDTGGGIEIFVCDDNSTDDSVDAVCKLAEDNPDVAIRIARNATNLDFSRNFEKTIRLSRGKFVFLMSNDDGLFPNAIKTVLEVVKKHPDIALGFFKEQAFEETLTTPIRPFNPGKDTYYSLGSEWVAENNSCVPCLISGWLLNRELWLGESREEWLASNALQIPIGMSMMAKYPCYWHRSTPIIRYREGNGVWNTQRDPLCPYSGLNAYFHGAYAMRGKYPPRLRRSIYWQAVRTSCGHTIRNKVLNIPIRLKDAEALLKPYFDYSWPSCVWTLVLRILLRTPKWMLYFPFRWLVPAKMTSEYL